MSDAPLIEGVGLGAVRGERVLFRDMSVSARAGELILLRGANGSGKTTLLRQLAGLSEPQAGKIERAGPPRSSKNSTVGACHLFWGTSAKSEEVHKPSGGLLPFNARVLIVSHHVSSITGIICNSVVAFLIGFAVAQHCSHCPAQLSKRRRFVESFDNLQESYITEVIVVDHARNRTRACSVASGRPDVRQLEHHSSISSVDKHCDCDSILHGSQQGFEDESITDKTFLVIIRR